MENKKRKNILECSLQDLNGTLRLIVQILRINMLTLNKQNLQVCKTYSMLGYPCNENKTDLHLLSGSISNSS